MRRILAPSSLLALAACGSSQRVSFTGEMKYGTTAEENYQAGVEELKDGNHAEAVKFFEYVKTKYPFSKFAALSELRLADVEVRAGALRRGGRPRTSSSSSSTRPTRTSTTPSSGSGVSYWKDAPGDFALFPPAHEKDQRQVEKAADGARAFVEKHPSSKHLARGEEAPRARRAAGSPTHEWYVAEYYFKRGHWAGGGGRLRDAREEVPGLAARGRGALEARARRTWSSTRATAPAPRSRSSS